MPEVHSTSAAPSGKPAKPTSDFPLYAHAAGYWAKKIKKKVRYFGPWSDPEGALRAYEDFLAGKPLVKAKAQAPSRPAKPYPEFPLYAHPAGQWAKRIRGKVRYFGKWADPDAALTKYNQQKENLHAGREPKPDPDAVTIKDVCNAFLNAKIAVRDNGELSPRTFAGYKEAALVVLDTFSKTRLAADLGAGDFAKLRNTMAKRWGPHRLGTSIQCVRSIFKHAYEASLLDSPMRFGPGFKRPSKKTLRLHRAKSGAKVFTRDEVRAMIDSAGLPLRAMILLGINCGFGNSDVGNLPLSAVGLDAGWIDFPRPKTGLPRRCPLWPETVEAIREALEKRPKPKDEADAGLVFITKYGDGWAKNIADSPVTKELRKLLNKLSIKGHRNFYALRHTFRTVADEARDQPAADHMMGHEVAHMSSVYREGISSERLLAVSNHVRAWLFAPAHAASGEAG